MYIIVAGGGKVGANVTRSLLEMGHELTMIEQRPDRFARLEEEFGPVVMRGDATEISVLERAGIARPPELLFAVTGDDEDNLVISQIGEGGLRGRARRSPASTTRGTRPTSTCSGSGRPCARRRASSASSSTRFRSTASCACSSSRRRASRSSRCRSRATRRSPARESAGSSCRRARGSSRSSATGAPSSWSRRTVMRPGRPGARGRLERLGAGAAQGAPRRVVRDSPRASLGEACLALDAQSRQ